MHRVSIAACLLGLLLLCDRAGAAETAGSDWDGAYGMVSKRRSDFWVNASLGLALGRVAGYPNEFDKLDNPTYRENTGFAAGSSHSFQVGVAFQDYLSFGIGVAGMEVQGRGRSASSLAFLLHVEAYPWFDYGKDFWDLGLFADVGGGVLDIKRGDDSAAEGGSMSVLGLGVSYERLRLGHFAFGPALQYRHMWSLSAASHAVLLELRASFYGGP